MSVHLERIPDDEEEQEFTSLGEEGTSLFDGLRSVNQKSRAKKSEEFDIPGYEMPELDGKSALVARYKRMNMEGFILHQREINEAVEQKRFDRVFELYAHFLIDHCEAIYKRVPDGDLEHVCPGYELALARGLDFDADGQAMNVVLGVFGDNELLVAEHAEQVFTWMRTGKSADDSEALGKS